MSVYGASFVRARPDRVTSFQETSRLLREAHASWLVASPTNFTFEETVRSSEGSDWVSISEPVADQFLEAVSRVLSTTAIKIYATDELVLRFSYSRFDDGQPVRALEYADDGNSKDRGKWTKVEGEPEPWEATLFSPRLMELYRDNAPEEAARMRGEQIKPGFSVPWPCDRKTIAEIARALQLPWEPTSWPVADRFPPATQIEVIAGSPERWPKEYKGILRQHRRPWWKFWTRGNSEK